MIKFKPIVIGKCQCGCGQNLFQKRENFVPRYIWGHHSRGKIPWNKSLVKETCEGLRKLSEKLRGRTKENDEGVRKRSEKLRGRTKETHEGVRRQAEKLTGRTKETDVRLRRQSERVIKWWADLSLEKKEEFFRRHSEKMTKWWSSLTQKEREEIWRKVHKGADKRPTSYEKKIIYLVNKYNLPYKYTGDGEVWLGNANPDFMNTDGIKVVLETYAGYWHSLDYEKVRSEHFSKYGYEVIFFNEDDLFRLDWEEHCLKKLEVR